MPATILIVEDNDDTRLFMRVMIEGLGFQVLEAVNGLEAIEAVRRKLPDLILMDIGMPVMDGITATKLIRRSDINKDIPIWAVTAHPDWFEEKSLKVGCNKVISKPVDYESLKQALFDFLPLHQ